MGRGDFTPSSKPTYMINNVNITSYSLGKKQNTFFLKFHITYNKGNSSEINKLEWRQMQEDSNSYKFSINSVTTVKRRENWTQTLHKPVAYAKAHVVTTPLCVKPLN